MKYNSKCGPNTTDNYDEYTRFSDGKFWRKHIIEGKGAVNSCMGSLNHFSYYSNYFDEYYIEDGITELNDACFNSSLVSYVSLPKTLIAIGSKCFKNSIIGSIVLPDGLQIIGHDNFPATLTSLTIPKNIKEFCVDNVRGCRDLREICVDENNQYYKAKDGILYNFDMTEILFCPNARSGNVVIPNTVTRIGDYCFAQCKSLDSIVVPTSVISIGDYAFQGTKIAKLNIRNSVRSIGVGCFAEAIVVEKFSFSNQVLSLSKSAFESFVYNSGLDFISRLNVIGLNAFHSCRAIPFPSTISLYKAREIEDCAFQSVKNITNVELFSSLAKFGDCIFDDCNNDLVVRYFAFAPLTAKENAIGKLGENAKLVVPKGTKVIFENITPWSTFPIIEEWEIDEDINDKGKFVKVSDEIYCKRLQSIVESKRKVDRFLLKEILEDLAQTFLYVDSGEEYDEAMSLIAYNRSFSPAIIPDLEKRLCKEWTNKYKLRIIENSLFESNSSLSLFVEPGVVQTLPLPVEVTLPMPESIEMSLSKENVKSSSVVAYFDEEILIQLQNHLALAKKSLKIAVSWFTNYSLFKQLKQMANDGIKIRMIINNDLINNGGYCLNFDELIGNKNVELSLVEYPHLLHHKYVIIDDDLLITGSYNWTRFSGKNYENMVVINDEELIGQFNNEFDRLVEKAEYKRIGKMPDYVMERPEYDRSAFKQYITEELDALARESSDERDKIIALKKATELNSQYLEKIHPGVQKHYLEEFKVVDNKLSIQSVIINIAQPKKAHLSKSSDGKAIGKNHIATIPIEKVKTGMVLTRQQESVIENVKASGLLLCLDVSGSMSDTYAKGHVHEIAKKALAASLTLTDEKEVNIWTFGDDAKYKGRYGINQIGKIQDISCENEGTYLQKFVEKANSSIVDGALCVIFTDDDSDSISAAVEGMKQRKNVFWQIIAYEQEVNNIKEAIKSINNISVISLSNYRSKTDDEISEMLLKDYVIWKEAMIENG